MGPVAGELSERLPPEPASVGRARRLVATAVTASGHDELVDVATLLISEVVTNAVLHAGTEIRLRCEQTATGIRFEISDQSPLLPAIRHYDAEAMTGRGLGMVSALATSWGVDREDDGKTLWFELGDGGGPNEASGVPAVVGEPRAGVEVALEIELRDASPPLVRATIEHGDALLRELALLALGGELDNLLPEGWQLPQFDVSPILEAAEAAGADGQSRTDLMLCLPAEAHTVAIERLRLVDHADALAREGMLLSAPALPEVAV